jgi:hypothetical protein
MITFRNTCYDEPSADIRRKNLMERYNFHCNCSACLNNWNVDSMVLLPQRDPGKSFDFTKEPAKEFKDALKQFKENCKYIKESYNKSDLQSEIPTASLEVCVVEANNHLLVLMMEEMAYWPF